MKLIWQILDEKEKKRWNEKIETDDFRHEFREKNRYPNTPLKSTCAYIELDKFKAKIGNEGL